ncbi:hypothetical protein [Brachyspira hampsonii]|uniref:hypothetical protein n=1 Tax=Brachyspira hampsonii TaxID=1287055 RepID=UPI000D348A90|nr:hypothetical protein [Brachyspira hampsonii]PTY40774.1 hypothetical protein DQ06_09510 [Brachyspira hampsonii bv. II]
MLISLNIKAYSQTTNTNDIKRYGQLSASLEMVAYGRMSDLIEQTGNEDTLGVLLYGDLHYIKEYKYASIEAEFNARFYEPLSHKARFYQNMSPPVFDFSKMNIFINFKYVGIRAGVLEPYTKNIPMTSYFPTLFYYHTVSSNKATVLSGPRDMPIGYETQFIPRYDTGLMVEANFFGVFIGVGLINGEMGLDANSSKGLMAKVAYSNDYINTGVAGIVTEIGSQPIKEWGDSVNAFFYFKNGRDGRFTVGIEGFWFRHGIRVDNEYFPGEANTNTPHFNNGYYTDFSVQTFNGGKPYYGMSGFIFFEARRLWKFDITAHFGIHDNNIFSDAEDIYQLKYRAFLKITFNVTDDFKIMISDTFTYDPVYKNNYQYYELENRNQVGVISYNEKNGHYTVDNDFYLGLSFKFGGVWGNK